MKMKSRETTKIFFLLQVLHSIISFVAVNVKKTMARHQRFQDIETEKCNVLKTLED